VSDSKNDPLSGLLSSFALGPAWARATGGQQERAFKPEPKTGDRPPRRDDRRNAPHGRDRDGERRPFQKRGGKFDDRRAGPPRDQEAPPAEGVRVTLTPDAQAVHLIGREIHQVARVYPLFDVAKILLAERGRCRAVFEAPEPHAPLLRGKLDESIFLTREEAVSHLWNSGLRDQLIEEQTIEVDPPTGNFLLVAKCGISGEWLGPPNFHSYQINLRRIHRERFPNMPFAAYSAKVRTERGEEAVNAWLESMKNKTRWRIRGDDDDAWIDDPAEARRALATRCFDQAFEQTRHTVVPASIPPKNLSPALMTSLKIAGNHARNHPAILIPAICKAVETEHLPVFKRQGKLFTGPARPQPLPPGATLAERPAIMVEWIRANKPAKLEGLWKAVLPEGGTAPPAEFATDLFWLLHQGHILLFTDDTLVVQDLRENPPATEPGSGKNKKKKSKKSQPPAANEARSPAGEAPSPVDDSPSPADEAPSPVADSPSLADEAPSPVDDFPSLADEAPSPVADSPSLADEAPSPVDDFPSLADEAPSPVDDSPSPADEALSSVDDSPSPADDAPSPVGEAPESTNPEVPEMGIHRENDLSKNPPAGVDESLTL